MSFKDLFDGASRASAIANKSAKEIGAEVESVGYHTQDIINEKRFIPNVDFNDPSTFARYGSAEEYYGQSIERVHDTYPYDGSLKERLEWENDSTYIDLHLLNNKYPRTNGYALLSAEGWGTQATIQDGWGLPSKEEYIYLKGGPHPNPDGMSPYSNAFTGSNYYEPNANRESNLKYDLAGNGVTVEFWLKKDEWLPLLTTKEVIFDMWNGVAVKESPAPNFYGRLMIALDSTADGTSPFLLTVMSGATGVENTAVGSSITIADGEWHHYALSFASASAGIATKLYVDGTLNTETTLGSTGINEVTGALRAYVGALITSRNIGASYFGPAGKLSGSLDEFRYWKTRRTSRDIGRYWFTQVGGGTNSDPKPYTDNQETVNTNLGVYFKFNEGITGVATTDSTVLDYSGRVSNGDWTGYSATSRNTGSAIVLSKAAIKEFKDPIIYSFHPAVVTLKSELETSGSSYDDSNSTSIYKSIPGWITEDDDAGQHQLKNLTQIISSYFDTLHMQIAEHNKLKDIEYISGSNKPFPYSNKLLNSQGFISPDIFVDADLFEQLADRSEDKLYEKSLSEVKNLIYQNIYNNLSYIYKAKGTEKAFRNLIRCFGLDDELIKLSMYARNTNYEFRENRRTILVNDRTINFNHPINTEATVYSYSSSVNPESTGYIPADSGLLGGYAVTLETNIFFPQKPNESDAYGYFDTNAITSSLFGIHHARPNQTDTGWGNAAAGDDRSTNFQVFSVRDEINSPNVRFMLTGTAGGYVPYLTSPLYEDVYTDTSWTLATRIRPERFPLANFVSGATTGDYVVELHGVQTRSGEVINTFTVSGTVASPPSSFMTGSRRVYLGAHKENVTGSTIYQTSDVRVNSCRFWIDYVEDTALKSHALDTENYGPSRPTQYASPWNKTAADTGEISELDTLAFNWEFSENTGSNALGKFSIADESSGSAALAASRYGFIGNLTGKQITAEGSGFAASSTDAVKKEFVVVSRLNELEVIAPSEMVTVLDADEQQVFKIDSRPINYFYVFEKSMSKVVSEAMVNSFGTLQAFNTLVGEPVNRFRSEYKNLASLRRKFFENVANEEIDFDKFYEFYKWFDSSLSYMLGQLVPASADFAQNIRTTIESTTLERSKYRSVFPFLEEPAHDFTASIGSNVDYGDAISSPDDDLQGVGFYPVHAPTARAIGRSPRALLQKWKYDHAPPDKDQKKNHLWWRNRAERNNPTIATVTAVNTSRAVLLQNIKEQTKRTLASPYRFSMSGTRVLGGVGQHQNKDVNFTFQATQPYGPTATPSGEAMNIMVSTDKDVELLLDTTDEFYPVYKQRLGFGINPGINRDNPESLYLKGNGNKLTPFSLYKSTVNSTYRAEISESYKSNVDITNLHHDFVFDTDIPLQGPFTEKYVGGRHYRHTNLNSGPVLDTAQTRAEGFRLVLGEHSGATDLGSLAIVPPNYYTSSAAPS
ncbi:MAG TPA: LamG domain-containing protein, partial [Flavobacteriales bacterium]|nr:LamG domain-containing protein [Flavobacteriales bacterium]